MTYFDYIYRLTCVCWVIMWRLYAIVSPARTMKTRLTYLYIVLSCHPRIIPTGSRLKWWGYAHKWAHPP